MSKRLAIVGATGAVGQLVCQLVGQREFSYDSVVFLASARSAGRQLEFDGQTHMVRELTPDSFANVDLAIGSTPDDVAREFVPWALESGAVVVDESGAHRMLPDVPLVVPEVNPEAIDGHQGIIASPNCSTTQMVICLKPLHDAFNVRRVIVTTYQATSGAGLAGRRDLEQGTRHALDDQPWESDAFQYPIAFNVVPQIGSATEDHYTSEEMKMVHETRKILGDESIQICPTCVRVPVTNCHSESIIVEAERPIPANEARELFERSPGVTVVDDLQSAQYPMPINADGRDDVLVGRIRSDISCAGGLAFWCVSDNLRKGAATNAVQIAELLASRIPCG